MAGSSSSYIIDDMMDIAAGLGEDLLMDILSRLSVKYVLRSRCVSKSWNALLKTPYFINKHLQRNRATLIQGNAPLLCMKDDQMIEKSWIFSSDFINDDETTTITTAAAAAAVEVPSTDPNPFSDGKTIGRVPMIMGPVNGIFFSAACDENGDRRNLYLCNPSLRELKAIPNPILFPCSCSFGFGYDPKANDYKVLAIVFDGRRGRRERGIYHVFLYSLRRDSWRNIECNDHMKSFWSRPREPIFVNHGRSRVAHWLITDDGDENGKVILSFDFVNEEFQRSSLPEALRQKLRTYWGQQMVHYFCQIGVLKDESIALIISLPPLSRRRCHEIGHFWEVWVMKEYGVWESWTKLFATGYLPGLSAFLGFVNNEREILFRDNLKNHLVSYDPYRKKSKDFLQLKGVRVNTYMESLVSIINGDH